MRKLASIRRIADIQPIEGADAIVVATIDGWKVVVKKSEFKVGDLAVYFEIDSWVPHDLAPFLSKGNEPREYGGVKGERLRTIKLRGTTSQGLLLKLENCFDIIEKDGIKYINKLDNQIARSSENEDIQDSKQE
jgi:RNA ligase (TIGR02306 family)